MNHYYDKHFDDFLFVCCCFFIYQIFFSLNERVGLLLLIVKYMHGLMQFQMGPIRIGFILKNAERKNIDKQNSNKGKHSIQR